MVCRTSGTTERRRGRGARAARGTASSGPGHDRSGRTAREVPAAGHLHEHRSPCQGLFAVRQAMDGRWALAAAGSRSSSAPSPPRAPAGRAPWRGVRRSASCRRCRPTPGWPPCGRSHRRAAQRPRDAPGREHLPHVGVGRPRLVVQVVAVVPPRHQPEVPHGRKRRSAGADHDLHVPPQHLEPGGVASLRPLIGGEPDVPARTEQCGQGSVDPATSRWSGTTMTEPRPPSSAACRLGQTGGPASRGVRRGGRQPRGGRRPAGGEVGQGGAPRHTAPRGGGGSTGNRWRRAPPRERAFSAAACRGGMASRRTSPSVPAPLRRGTRSGQQARDEHGLGRDHPAQRASRPSCSASDRRSRTNPSRSWPAKRLDPAPRLRRLDERLRDGVLERPGRGGAGRCRRTPTPPDRWRRRPRATAVWALGAAASGSARAARPPLSHPRLEPIGGRRRPGPGSVLGRLEQSLDPVGPLPREGVLDAVRVRVRPKWP